MISLFKNVVKWVRIVLAIKGSEIFKLYNTLLNKDTRNCSNLENNKYSANNNKISSIKL